MKKIVLASHNTGKIKEFEYIFSQLNIEIIPQQHFNVPEIDEPFGTFIENALHKARHCSKFTKLPSLADDSGICINSLNGAPGVYSARYAGTPSNTLLNNQKLVQELNKFSDKSGYFYCVLVLVRHYDDPQPIFADGHLNGEIISTPRGNNGFGYNPHFYLPQYQKTIAEITTELRNQISHRAIALRELIKKLHINEKDSKIY